MNQHPETAFKAISTPIDDGTAPLQMTLVAAIHYITDRLGMDEGEIIHLDCFEGEGRELQECARKWEHNLFFDNRANDEAEVDAIPNFQFRCFFPLLVEHGLCLQFLDTYPVLDGNTNLRVLIMRPQTAQIALKSAEGTLGMVMRRKAHSRPGGALDSGGGAPDAARTVARRCAGPSLKDGAARRTPILAESVA